MIAILATSRQVHSVTGRHDTSESSCGPPSVPFFPMTSKFCIDVDRILVRLVERQELMLSDFAGAWTKIVSSLHQMKHLPWGNDFA